VVTKGEHPTVCGMGESEAAAQRDAEPRGLGSLLDARCVDATDAALCAWRAEDPDPDHPSAVYLATDGVVRLPLHDDEDDEDDNKAGPISTFVVELVVRGDPDDAAQALKVALDNGVLQDAINAYDGPRRCSRSASRPATRTRRAARRPASG
jgi:hypothetical protein